MFIVDFFITRMAGLFGYEGKADRESESAALGETVDKPLKTPLNMSGPLKMAGSEDRQMRIL